MPWKPPAPPASGSGVPPNSTAWTGSSSPAANRPRSTSSPGSSGSADPLRERIQAGLPVYGSCAGMILLADEIADPAKDLAGNPQQTFGGLDITVRRNAFGRQRESFETDLDFKGLGFSATGSGVAPVHAVFIRGPWVERVGQGVEVLAQVEPRIRSMPRTPQSLDGTARIVAVRSGKLLATSFHPEVTGEKRVHELFIRMIRGEA